MNRRRPMPETETMAEDGAEATLELTILSLEGLKDSIFLGNPRPFVVAWVDPSIKRSTKAPHARPRSATPQKLHLPLSSQCLWDPSSCLAIQILSPRLPFQSGKPIGTATLHISSLSFSGETLTLPLRGPSGRSHGMLRLSVRILWCLGAAPVVVDFITGGLKGVDGLDLISAQPTAPPMPEDLSILSEFTEEAEGTGLHPFYPSAPVHGHDAATSDSGSAEVEAPDMAQGAEQTGLHPFYPSAPVHGHDAATSDSGSAEIEAPDMAQDAERTGLHPLYPSALVHGHDAATSDSGSAEVEAPDMAQDAERTGLHPFYPSAPGHGHDAATSDSGSAEVEAPDLAPDAKRTAPEVKPDWKNAWGSFLVGLISGTVASVLVGAAGLSEG